MDCVFGIQGNDYVLIASDRSVARSIVKLKDSEDKLTLLSDNQILGAAGEVADRNAFTKLIKGELEYYYYKNNNRLNTDEVANFTRTILAENLRKSPFQANCLIAGYDKEDGPKLYWMDYLGSLQKVKKAAHGYGGNFLYGIMDNMEQKDTDIQTGLDCIKNCIFELKKRFLINMVDFTVYLINNDGMFDISNDFNNSVDK